MTRRVPIHETHPPSADTAIILPLPSSLITHSHSAHSSSLIISREVFNKGHLRAAPRATAAAALPRALPSALAAGASNRLLDELDLTYPQYLVMMVLWGQISPQLLRKVMALMHDDILLYKDGLLDVSGIEKLKGIGSRETLLPSALNAETAFPDAQRIWKFLNYYFTPTANYLTEKSG